MARGLRSSHKSAGANHLGPKKGSAPSPHQSPGRAAGSGPTSTSPVSAKSMGKSAGNSNGGKGIGTGSMTKNPASPLVGHKQKMIRG